MNETSEVAYARLAFGFASLRRTTRQQPRQATSRDDKTINTQLSTLSRNANVGGLKMVRTMGSTSD